MIYPMTPRQQLFAILAGAAILIFIVDLVRRRRLRAEYAWLWLSAGVAVLVAASWYDALDAISRLIGAALGTTTVFLLSILFLMAVCIHLCTKVSMLSDQVKRLAQELAVDRTP